MSLHLFFFFFSSRRRHTRCLSDWSSDVCSSDLHRWRAGGIMLQFLPRASKRARVADLNVGRAPDGREPHAVEEDDAWAEGQALISTAEDIELIDPSLSSEQLVYRLFHEPGVRVVRASPLRAECSCSRDNVEAMLKSCS